ncbi:hypothetical protein [Roseateles sp. PN1]|uniref:hypothetical protein n=1 Tax=Roseateles sp. PN1 TaxID=3137372 RepID=UPI0031398E4D
MNYQAKPLPADCEPWHLPHMEAGKLLMAEDAMGICDTCPGELDSPESVYQAEPAKASMPWRGMGAGLVVVLVALLSAHILVRL